MEAIRTTHKCSRLKSALAVRGLPCLLLLLGAFGLIWQGRRSQEELTPHTNVYSCRIKRQISGLNKNICCRILIRTIPTILFTSVTVTILIADYALASMLGLLLKYGQFGISFAGMEYGVNLGDLFNEVTAGKQTMASLKLEGKTFLRGNF